MFGFFKDSQVDEDAELMKQALGPNVAVVVSASCCMQGTAPADDKIEAITKAVIESEGLDWPVLTVTVTQAQSSLGRISGQLTDKQAEVARAVSELFLSTGLSAFPVLVVNQRIVSYGGVPGEQLVRDAVKSATRERHETAA